jgi:hypothetical protein
MNIKDIIPQKSTATACIHGDSAVQEVVVVMRFESGYLEVDSCRFSRYPCSLMMLDDVSTPNSM